MKPHLLLQWRMALRRTASAASEVLWFHGTNSTLSMNSIIKSQELYGSGDLGNGGYVSSDPSWATEYGQLVAVILEPRNPKYGGERELWGFRGDYTAMLREQGHDVWFPTDGTGPSNPGQIAVILDSSCAKFFRAPQGLRNPTPRTSEHDRMAESARRSWTASLVVAAMPNKYPGKCSGCLEYVDRGEGVYEYGSLWCSEPKERESVVINGESVFVEALTCDRGRKIEARIILKAQEARKNFKPKPPTPEEVAAEQKRRQERDAQDAAWAKKHLRRCTRCDGAGGSSHWPGWTCYECGGVGATVKF